MLYITVRGERLGLRCKSLFGGGVFDWPTLDGDQHIAYESVCDCEHHLKHSKMAGLNNGSFFLISHDYFYVFSFQCVCVLIC